MESLELSSQLSLVELLLPMLSQKPPSSSIAAPVPTVFHAVATSSQCIAAVRLVQSDLRLTTGAATQINPHATLLVCGPGHNESTVTVYYRGIYYLVFRRDIKMLTANEYGNSLLVDAHPDAQVGRTAPSETFTQPKQ